jgi:hypothetical protein
MPTDRRNARARNRPVTQALCRLGRRKPDGEQETRFEKLAERLWELALEQKDRIAIRLIMEYCEGRPAPALAEGKAAGARLAISADDLERATRELAAWEAEVEDGRPGSEAGGEDAQPAPLDAPAAPRTGGPAGLHAEAAG